nr:MAG TPA: hypothetical protein [Caudoviricetes sp.]
MKIFCRFAWPLKRAAFALLRPPLVLALGARFSFNVERFEAIA